MSEINVQREFEVPPGFVFKPGRVRVASINVLHAQPHILIFDVDCDSKYFGTVLFGHTSKPDELMLVAGAETLHTDSSAETETVIVLPKHTAGWSALCDEGGKYSVRVAAWEYPDLEVEL